jgi:hypothetical protein
MKKISILCTLVIASISVFAQPDNYVFTVSKNVPYQNLVSPTIVTTPGWDDFDATIPLGFNFKFMGDSTNTLFFDSNDMNTGTELQFNTTANTSNPFHVISWFYDLEDRFNNDVTKSSTVGYKTDVVNAKNVTKIEWNNVGFFDDTFHVDTANVQFWIYEENNALEFRIGNSSRANITSLIQDPNVYGFKGPVFAFVKNLTIGLAGPSADNIYYPSNINTPTMDSTDIMSMFTNPSIIGIDSFPNANTLMRWAPAVANGVNGVSLNENISVYPTLFASTFSINFKAKNNYQLSVFDINGRFLFTQKLAKSSEKIDMSNYASGNYILMLNNDSEKIVYQITKK